MLGSATQTLIPPAMAQKPTKQSQRRHTTLKLSLPTPPSPSELFQNEEWFWYEGKRIRRSPLDQSGQGGGEEEEEYDCGRLNLGAETPYSGSMTPNTSKSYNQNETIPEFGTIAAQETGQRLAKEWAVTLTGKPEPSADERKAGPPSSRRNSVSGKKSTKKEADRDCGICFEYAVRPARTLCCSKVFCKEHLNDWLHGPNASGLCPNCDAPCTLEDNTLSLVSSTLRSQPPVRPQHHERLMAQRLPSSPLSTSLPITHHRSSSAEVGKPISSPTSNSMTVNATSHTSMSLSSPSKSGSAIHETLQTPTTASIVEVEADQSGMAAWEILQHILSHQVDSKSGLGSSTPSIWAEKGFQTKGKKTPSVYDSIFGSQADTFRTVAHLATLVAFLMLIYVVVN